jgi:hypothetical protein
MTDFGEQYSLFPAFIFIMRVQIVFLLHSLDQTAIHLSLLDRLQISGNAQELEESSICFVTSDVQLFVKPASPCSCWFLSEKLIRVSSPLL